MENQIEMEHKGGFSKALWENQKIQGYLKEMNTPAGWIGHDARTNELDELIEKTSKAIKQSDDELAGFIISKQGRWLGDKLGTYLSQEDIKKKIVDSLEA
ncbi:MAG: hypothetical protein QXY21_01970, partial [Candidatus Micrarchaeaceae archaeon]